MQDTFTKLQELFLNFFYPLGALGTSFFFGRDEKTNSWDNSFLKKQTGLVHLCWALRHFCYKEK